MAAASALLFAGKSVATPAISFLINQAFSYLKKWRNADGMEALEARLSARMDQIQAVFDAVDRQQVKEQSAALDKWLWRLRSAVEEAEDAVDEVKYRELEDNARAWDLQDKVGTGIPMTRFINRMAGFMPKRSTLKRLREALKKLDEVAEGVGTFLQLASRPHCRHQDQSDVPRRDRETASTVIAGNIIGRDREKEQIVGWLMEAEQIKEEPELACANGVSILSVVGVGGMGKTTLARLVCNDTDVVRYFDFVVWVWVSNSFDAATVIRNVLESIDKEKPTVGALDTLQKILMQKLSSKKFLLVLDDVWEDGNNEEWEYLVAPLQTGQKGSKILLTTRMQSVADMAAGVIGCKAEVLKLNGLDEGADLALFKRHAFASIAPERCADFLLTSEQIVEKMRGCPLMTKVVGGHLRDNMTRQYWNWFLHEEMHHFTGGTDNVAMALRLSYHHLPAHLQLCFRYCSIFPQGYKFKKEELVKMWMCSGMIMQTTGNTRRLEDVGEEYLALLTRKSFFDLKQELSEEYYVMHELLHDLARIASFGECLRIDGVGHINILSTVRHLWVAKLSTLSTQVLKIISELKNLRTVTIEGSIGEVNIDVLAAIREAVKSFKGLRVLSLYGLEKFYFPIDVANMKHLCYISLPRGQKVYGLRKLYHLQVLIARGTIEIEPKQLRNLSCLRYVACDTNEFGCFPVGRLTSLQELQNFQVQPSKGYEICSLRDLNSLHKLEVLGLENVGSHEEAKKAKLHEKEHLRSLLLQWSGGKCVPKREDDLVLDQLEPHFNLEELKISGHNGVRPPTWMRTFQFANLSSLELQGCNWEYLPPLGELQLLRHVRLENLPELKHIGQFYDVSRSGHHDLCLPLGLRSLTVRRCAKFQELAVLPPNLAELEIDNVGWITFPRVETQTVSCQLISIQISNCENIISVEETLLQQMGSLWMNQCGDLELALLGSLHGLDNLTRLILMNCSRVTSLPSAEVFSSLKSLREMDIWFCENLQSLGGLGALPSSLTRLTIVLCSKLTADAAPSLPAYASDGNEGEGNLTVVKSERWPQVTYGRSDAINDVSEDVKLSDGDEGEGLFELAEPPLPGHASSEEDGEGDLVPGCSFQVHNLCIDDPSLLLVKPLRSLCQTRDLFLWRAHGWLSDGSWMVERWLQQNRSSLESLWMWIEGEGAESLELLPPSIRDLCCLQRLWLFDAGRLRSLPDLPSSLHYLHIDGCSSELEAQCRGGSERDKIANIPYAWIGRHEYELGKLVGCSCGMAWPACFAISELHTCKGN